MNVKKRKPKIKVHCFIQVIATALICDYSEVNNTTSNHYNQRSIYTKRVGTLRKKI